MQESAAPYHDWNERITSQATLPTAPPVSQNKQNQIIRIVNNYARMSFNFGATLLSWLADFAPRTYRMILDADAASMERYSATALQSHRFTTTSSCRLPTSAMHARRSAGASPTSSIASAVCPKACGSPRPPSRARSSTLWPRRASASRSLHRISARAYGLFTRAVNGRQRLPARMKVPGPRPRNASVDPTRPYLVKLDEGRSIAVFFYDGPASRAIAFEGLLNPAKTSPAASLISSLRQASRRAPARTRRHRRRELWPSSSSR